MPRDYRWASRWLPRGDWLTIGDLALLLDLSRFQAWRIFRRSGLPGVLILKLWKDDSGRPYSRAFWALPGETVQLLLIERDAKLLQRFGRPRPPRWRQRAWRLRCRLAEKVEGERPRRNEKMPSGDGGRRR